MPTRPAPSVINRIMRSTGLSIGKGGLWVNRERNRFRNLFGGSMCNRDIGGDVSAKRPRTAVQHVGGRGTGGTLTGRVRREARCTNPGSGSRSQTPKTPETQDDSVGNFLPVQKQFTRRSHDVLERSTKQDTVSYGTSRHRALHPVIDHLKIRQILYLHPSDDRRIRLRMPSTIR